MKRGASILDPFCGGGTTLLASKFAGFDSQGVDILPFSVFLSRVKTQDYEPKALLKDLLDLQSRLRMQKRVVARIPSDIDLLDKAFPKVIQNELLRIKTCIDRVQNPTNRDFFKLGFLSTLEFASNTTKAGGFLRLVDRKVSLDSVASMFNSRCANMFADVLKLQPVDRNKLGATDAIVGDARSLELSHEFDAVITSPPYPNRHDYTRIYALEMAFDFVSSNADLKKIRYRTLRSHVEAKRQHLAAGYTEPKVLSRLIAKAKKNGVNNIQVPAMLSGYFEDMHLCLSQMKRVVKPNGSIGLVVSNVRFAGVNFPVDTILAEIGLEVGLKTAKVWTARNRGNSAQQMRDHSRKTSRESIVIWTN